MTDIQLRKSERSEEYTRLLHELKNSFVSAGTMAERLYEQGKKDGLSNEEIRKDIETALDGVVKERRLRKILPIELKRQYAVNSALSAESDADLDMELQAIIAEVRKEQPREIFDSDYDIVSREAFGVLDKIYSTHIPELCEALHRKRPELDERDIKRQIVYDLINIYPGIVNDPTLGAWTIAMK
jgi:hypothetical protein